MTIKRLRVDRNASTIDKPDAIVYTGAAWSFSLTCPGNQEIKLDFHEFRKFGRDSLAAQVRDAFWSLRHKSSAASLTSYLASIRRFWKFLDSEQATYNIIRLNQIDRACVDRFLTWLELQVVAFGQPNAGQKLSVALRRQIFCGLKAILADRQLYVPAAVNQTLSFPRNPYPNANRQSSARAPYSDAEYKRFLAALNTDLRCLSDKNTKLPELQILIVYLLSIASASGANLQPLLEITEDSLSPHALGDRETLTLFKRRGWTTISMSVRRSSESPLTQNSYTIPKSVGDHVRALAAYTAPLREDANNPTREFLFQCRVARGNRKNKIIHLTRTEVKTGIRDFARRHGLVNDEGAKLALSYARIRPTFANQLYLRTRDIRSVSQALGHKNIEITARTYLSMRPEATRDHAITVENFATRFIKVDTNGTIVLAADGEVPAQKLMNLRRDGYPTGIAHCVNPFREEDSVCKKFFTCFRCPNLMIFEDDLWRLFSFYYKLLSERHKLASDHWMKTYAPILRRIDDDIAPLFHSEKVLEAKNRARATPHPAWK